MKYQSEIIKEIIDPRGHDKSSLHYESECIESWIDEHKGAYPKLCDYQSEWLNYINESPIGEFPYETVINVTEATVNNVVPYAYKSASLKGNTLVNIATKHHGGSNEAGEVLMTPTLLKANTKYYIKVIDNEFNLTKVSFRTKDWTDRWYYATNGDVILTTPSQTEFNNFMYLTSNVTKNGKEVEIDDTIRDRLKWIICEYQEGIENWDIPYFEGIQSVQVPVLTTSNEDGTKTNILTVNEEVELRGIGDVKDELDLLTGEVTERIGEVVLDGSQNLAITQTGENTIRYQYVFNDKSYGFTNVVSDILSTANVFANDIECISGVNNNSNIMFRLSKEKATNVQECKQYLQQNPITVHYERITPTIKTVDLTIVNQDGKNVSLKPIEGTMHLSTSSETIKPLFSGEIPVEAITQNLASFIEE